MSKLISAANKKTRVPPGILPDKTGHKNIVIASFRRSGTHILIDLILNNFSPYKRNPLYVDIDQSIGNDTLKQIQKNHGLVLKTHFPILLDNNEKQLKKLNKQTQICLGKILRESYVIIPDRDVDSIRKSLDNFYEDKVNNLAVMKESFHTFWKDYKYMTVDFDSLVDNDKCEEVIRRISNYINLKNDDLVLPLNKSNKYQIYYNKLMTRLIGYRSKRINTSIKVGDSE